MLRPCVLRHTQPHDIVRVTMWLKKWAEGRKGKEFMIVNQELDLVKREKIDGIWGGLFHKHISFLYKSAGVGLPQNIKWPLSF